MSDVISIVNEGNALVYQYAWWYAALWMVSGGACVLTGFLSHKLHLNVKVVMFVVGVIVMAHSVDLFSNEVRLLRDRVELRLGNWWNPQGTTFSYYEIDELALGKPSFGSADRGASTPALIAKPVHGSPFVIKRSDLVSAAEGRILDIARLHGVKVVQEPDHVFCLP